MEELYEKSLKKLELDKVLDMLAEQAASEAAKARCRAVMPLTDAEGHESAVLLGGWERRAWGVRGPRRCR